MNRRTFIASACAAAIAPAIAGSRRVPSILLRSSWQTVNIGDIAHTPGMLALLERHLPDVEVRLWPSKVDNGVEELLMTHFPRLKIIKTKAEREAAFRECDFLLHGSGPSLVAKRDVIRWADATGKPYGIGGITFSLRAPSAVRPDESAAVLETIRVFNGARFVYFRDSVSLELAKSQGCTCPVMEFGPDGAFATNLREEQKAQAFLEANNLKPGQFLCCIPRLRYTPYWLIAGHKVSPDPVKHARNEAMKEHDHAQLRQAIIEVVRQTQMKVLVCPEDQTQMAVGKEMLYDPLPESVKKRVVWRPDYWLTGEALSTYLRSAGLFGNEMHSPIMCIGNGIPAIVCRWAEQTSKGIMWQDIGLGEWLFDLDQEEQLAGIVPAVLAIAKHPKQAKAKAEKARAFVAQRQVLMMEQVKKNLAVG
jgi:polysaccharide pyruvyl transferase WcaK-like protein